MEDDANTSALDTIARELARIRHGLEAAAAVPIPDDEIIRQPWGGLFCKVCGQSVVEQVQGDDYWTRTYVYVHSTGRPVRYSR